MQRLALLTQAPQNNHGAPEAQLPPHQPDTAQRRPFSCRGSCSLCHYKPNCRPRHALRYAPRPKMPLAPFGQTAAVLLSLTQRWRAGIEPDAVPSTYSTYPLKGKTPDAPTSTPTHTANKYRIPPAEPGVARVTTSKVAIPGEADRGAGRAADSMAPGTQNKL